MDTLTLPIIAGIGALALALLVYLFWIIFSYVRGLKGSPRELWFLYVAKIIEYAAYGSANMAFILFLSDDVGLTDIGAGGYITAWSLLLTIATIAVGPVVDAIGVKRTLLIGTTMLLLARIVMPFSANIWLVSILGFIPVAIGTAFLGPVLSVGIKRFTTREGATLGFGLFYTLMNVGWALGGLIFDGVRRSLGEHAELTVLGGLHMSTYQVIFLVGFFLTIPSLLLFLSMRAGVERVDSGEVVITPPAKAQDDGRGMLAQALTAIGKSLGDTGRIFLKVIRHKAFWYYMFMLGLLVFVRLVFYHFHYTFPKYGIRVLGEGVKIGNIYGVLNPTLIVFLVPFIAALTKRVSSFRMLIIGTTVSTLAVFLATIPASFYQGLTNTWLGTVVFDWWLDVPLSQQTAEFFSLIVFIVVFTIGEAIWSPRLMQFSAEIAPKGQEGTYLSLAYLPYFASKMIVGPMAGWLVHEYTPETMCMVPTSYFSPHYYPDHTNVWLWVGGMAAISPLGLILFRKIFHKAERGELYEEEATA